MELLTSFRDPDRLDLVCRLHKSIYGLKQALRQLLDKVKNLLVNDFSFTSNFYKPCVYVKHNWNSMILIVLYVDDLLIAGNNQSKVNMVKDDFRKPLKMKDLGAHEFLGIRIHRNQSQCILHISQTNCINKIVEKFEQENEEAYATPIDILSKQHVSSDFDRDVPTTNVLYRQAIGSFMYLMVGTLPGIAYAVGKLANYCGNPTMSRWNGVKRVLRYVSGTRENGIIYGKLKLLEPIEYSDSDWAIFSETRKSTKLSSS